MQEKNEEIPIHNPEGQQVVRGAIACMLLASFVLAAYSGFAWLETTRGKQVYPAGTLLQVMVICGGLALCALATAVVLFRRLGIKLSDAAAKTPSEAEEKADSGRQTPWSGWAAGVLLVAAIAFATFAVRHSTTQGRMAFPPYYDDVGYFDDAMRRLFVLYDGGLWAFLSDYAKSAPHAPTSTLLGMAGFGLFGVQDWAPASMSFLLVFGLLLLTRWFTYELPLLLQLPVYGFVLAWPFVFLSVVHCIPDFLCCAAMAAGAWLIAATPWAAGPRTAHWLAGVLFGIALFAKPAMYPVTMVIFTSALLAGTAWCFSESGMRGILFRAGAPALRAAAGCLLISLPHYLVNWGFIQDYIRINTFGSRRDLWKFEGPLSKQFAYYISGDGGQYVMGVQLWGWVAVAILAGMAAYRARSVNALRATIGSVTVLGATHAVVSVTSYKSVFLGMTIPAFLLISGTAMLAYALRQFRSDAAIWTRAGLLASVGVSLVCAAQFRPQPMMNILAHITTPYPRAGVEFIKEAEYRRAYFRDILGALRQDERRELRIGVFRGNLFFMPFVFQYQGRKDRTRNWEFVDANSYGKDGEAFRKEASGVDYLAGIIPEEPGSEERLLAELRSFGGWEVAGRWPAEVDRGRILLLSNSYSWRSLQLDGLQTSGFGHLEGPYKPATFTVRWGYGPGATLPISIDAPGKYVLAVSAQTPLPGQFIEVAVDGKAPTKVAVPNNGEFHDLRIPIAMESGRHIVGIRYGVWVQGANERPLAVLFRKFRIEQEP